MPVDEGMMMPENPMAPEGAAMLPEDAGRGGDTVLAHVSPGEVILPAEIVGEFVDELVAVLGEEELMARTVGHPSNRINPETGYPEFWFGIGRWFKKQARKLTGQAKMEKEMKRQAAIQKAEMARQAEEMRIFQAKEMRKAKIARLSSARSARKKEEAMASRQQKIEMAKQLGIQGAGDIADVAAQRGGVGKLKSAKAKRSASTEYGYGKYKSKIKGLSLALRPGYKTRRPA